MTQIPRKVGEIDLAQFDLMQSVTCEVQGQGHEVSVQLAVRSGKSREQGEEC